MRFDLHILRKTIMVAFPLMNADGRIDYSCDGHICTGLRDRSCVSSLSHFARKCDQFWRLWNVDSADWSRQTEF
jgi:hypothetical protein